MKVNIEIAEEIIKSNNPKLQRKSLHDIIKQVESKRTMIQDFIITVNLVSKSYQQKSHTLEYAIQDMTQRTQSLDQDVTKLQEQQAHLESVQSQLKQDLDALRVHAERCRLKKTKRQHRYHTVAALPLLSRQSKKQYIKARDAALGAEQQVSETRSALDQCQGRLRWIAKALTSHHAERDSLSEQRRGSMDRMQSTNQHMAFLKKGCVFWEEFDTYQAKVVLETATFLHQQKKPNQVWIRTFLMACFEYGDREVYGDQWSPDQLEVVFECALCHKEQFGWPYVARNQLICSSCYVEPNKTTVIETKMRKIVHYLFHSQTKINPIKQ